MITNILAAAGACGNYSTTLDTSCLSHASANNTTINTVLNIVFALVASITVLIIVIAGFRYIVAHGDPNATAQARNTILYALIGLLVTMAAYSIVVFVVGGVS